ncbi:RNA polymerase sigma factor [Acrocarpospora catenulata]|uniref:RNA polymerase sigma factor n=1 Tax=Acrocarpospora catenulata TaxID=2836182 RepID=UPI001BDB0F6F|nr:sigma-70 family RNA polymerase sigma factor [Acrocarpospora catenulata]
MAEDSTVADLVVRARKGDQDAWDQLLDRYNPFILAICRRYRLSREDMNDVAQTVWLRAVQKLGSLQTPGAFPGWLATVTQRECLHTAQAARRRDGGEYFVDFDRSPDEQAAMVGRELELAELRAALRAAFAQLPPRCRELLLLLMRDEPMAYVEIAERLRMSVGGIGPTRGRCLERLRQSPYLMGFLGPEADDVGSGGDG